MTSAPPSPVPHDAAGLVGNPRGGCTIEVRDRLHPDDFARILPAARVH